MQLACRQSATPSIYVERVGHSIGEYISSTGLRAGISGILIQMEY